MFDCLIEYWKSVDLNEDLLFHESDYDLVEKNNQRPDKYRLHLNLFGIVIAFY